LNQVKLCYIVHKFPCSFVLRVRDCTVLLSNTVISIIIMPKLYMSDMVEISPLYRYSGAMSPLQEFIKESNIQMSITLFNLKENHISQFVSTYFCPLTFTVYIRVCSLPESRESKISNLWHPIIIQPYRVRHKIHVN